MKNVKYYFLGVVTVVSVCIIMGCTTSGIEGKAKAVATPSGDTQLSKYVIVNNPKLARGIQIVDLQHSYAGDLLKAQVTMVSKYSKTLNIQYKFAWFNDQGIEINPDGSPWTPLLIYGNETKSVQGVAPNPSAKEFKIQIRGM
jgi:uncharacterized protein YcfL